MKRSAKLVSLIIPFGIVSGIAVVSILFAMGLIEYDGKAVWATFFRNVGYSIFAGAIVIAFLELYRHIASVAQKND